MSSEIGDVAFVAVNMRALFISRILSSLSLSLSLSGSSYVAMLFLWGDLPRSKHGSQFLIPLSLSLFWRCQRCLFPSVHFLSPTHIYDATSASMQLPMPSAMSLSVRRLRDSTNFLVRHKRCHTIYNLQYRLSKSKTHWVAMQVNISRHLARRCFLLSDTIRCWNCFVCCAVLRCVAVVLCH